ncbi:hypothetical protein D0C36_15370 [Mucilaginibacter conchicola]|uniref:MalT-like TPR region domain-containing protein n=2 Tax=Mucilaginibacter conchicola TaxID=2303333 RepID=A0A372NU77_9SPHI|nr:hypothetical protein D0C36_15370 [Mucilaginibacter conchicola]
MLAAFNLTASAQWYKLDFKKHVRYPQVAAAKYNALKREMATYPLPTTKKIAPVPPMISQLELEAGERIIMRAAQHFMRFRQYGEASYRFSELAQLYAKANRLSEAKWYYLQSNNISRQQNDYPHTISNLICLALIKADLGDLSQAHQDLTEARDMARSTGRAQDLKLCEEKLKFIQTNKTWLPKSELRYADAAEVTAKSK